MCIDQCRINVAFYSPNTSTTAVINMGPDNFKVSATCLTTPPILITFLTATRMLYMTSHSCRCWKVGTSTTHHTKFRVSDNSDANIYRSIYITHIVQCCCECWFTGSIRCSEIYSRYTSRTTKQLRFHHELRRRRTRQEIFWIDFICRVCFWTRNISRPLEKMCLEFAIPSSILCMEVFFVSYNKRISYEKIDFINLDKICQLCCRLFL